MKIFFALFIWLCSITQVLSAQAGMTEFTSSGTFTVPPGITSVVIEVVGAGGSGGYNGSGGGGGGGYAAGSYSVSEGQILNVTVGIPGQGSEIGTTSVDELISATGGANGVTVGNPEIGGGGAGGVGLEGNIITHTGGNGGGGYYTYFGGGGGGAGGPLSDGGNGGNTILWTGQCLTPGGDAGESGGSPGGDGGKGAGFTDANCTVSNPASNGLSYGGGGGGGNGINSTPGMGGNGYAVTYYCGINTAVSVSGATITAAQDEVEYQWIDCLNKGSIIDNATGQSYTATQNGSYAVILTSDECVLISECVEIVLSGIDGLFTDNVVVYPNPFSERLSMGEHQPKSEYQLISSIGEIVWQGDNIADADFSGLQSAVYFIRHTANSAIVRVVKK